MLLVLVSVLKHEFETIWIKGFTVSLIKILNSGLLKADKKYLLHLHEIQSYMMTKEDSVTK